MSQAALGRALKLSPAAITKLKKQGMPVDSVDSAQAWRTATLSVARRKRDAPSDPLPTAPPAPPPAPPPASSASLLLQPDYNVSRARREAAEAELAELRLKEERCELVRAADVRAAMARRAAGLREALLQLPARVVPLLVSDPSAASMDRLLHTEIVRALEQLTAKVE